MSALRVVWDEKKSAGNCRKHGVSFEEASSVFLDSFARVFFDPDHSDTEDRFLILGLSIRLRVLVVCHCYREAETLVRIISARRADTQEEHDYWSRR